MSGLSLARGLTRRAPRLVSDSSTGKQRRGSEPLPNGPGARIARPRHTERSMHHPPCSIWCFPVEVRALGGAPLLGPPLFGFAGMRTFLCRIACGQGLVQARTRLNLPIPSIPSPCYTPGWTHDTMRAPWDTTQHEDDSVARTARPQIWLSWVFPEAGAAVPLEHGAIIGRDTECSIQLTGNGVSRRHLELHRQGPIFAIKDLGSTNGTFLNGRRIQHGPVAPGGVLRVGEHVGIFLESVAAPSSFRAIATGLLGGHELSEALVAMQRAATSDIPIVIIGATGTGKERVARAIHALSGREGAFQAINCAALPKDLAEAELFGYRKGAFTGADRASLGHFRAADGGTLFLDEIAELPLSLQAKLLRVLEDRTVTRLGDTDPVHVDVRVVAAAQRPLAELVEAQQFREDLLARLAGLTVALPPLRERRADVAALFQHFIAHYSGGRPPRIDSKLIECLCLHEWPNNVRELEQLARQLLAVHGLEPILKRAMLPKNLSVRVSFANEPGPSSTGKVVERRDHDARQLTAALKKTSGNVREAAALLGFSRQRAYRLLDGKSHAEVAEQKDPERGRTTNGEEA